MKTERRFLMVWAAATTNLKISITGIVIGHAGRTLLADSEAPSLMKNCFGDDSQVAVEQMHSASHFLYGGDNSGDDKTRPLIFCLSLIELYLYVRNELEKIKWVTEIIL